MSVAASPDVSPRRRVYCHVAELFSRYQGMNPDDPARPTVVRAMERCLTQAISCDEAAFVSSTKADCNFTLVKRDACLKSYDIPASVQKRLRDQPFHGSAYVHTR